jgi:hypothetical protein
MDPLLSAEVGRLAHFGWRVRSQTESTAALETQSPFNWLFFALAILLFFGLGGLLYIVYWLVVSREHLFLHIENGQVVSNGDTWLVEQQRVNEVEAHRVAVAIKQRGFWSVMWPSIVATLVMLVLWIVVIRIAVALFR